ncbi:hypothetical protein C0991_006577 [Blastosporella zonata]|nr:hypothetical protein C0991_006577 [Blastosporella zonata]
MFAEMFAPSSPSIASSVNDKFDELADMFSSSPDTSVVDAMNLVQDVKDSKLDEIQIPRDRRIGGSLGLLGESIVDKAQKAGGLGAFLTPLLTPWIPAAEKGSMDCLHPLLYKRMIALLPSTTRDSAPSQKDGRLDALEAEVNSMLGQAFAVTSLSQCAEVSEEDDIRGLYQDLSRPGDE